MVVFILLLESEEMFAQLCIDIPASKVDHLYTYKVPEKYQAILEVGMRVQVPFGPRQLMGIVIEILDKVEVDYALKSIGKLLDYRPNLNQELIDLSADLAEELQCFRIDVLKAMLPAMFKVKYKTVFQILDCPSIEHQLKLNSRLERVNLSVASMDQEAIESLMTSQQIADFIKRGWLRQKYQVIDRQSQLSQTMLRAQLSQAQYQEILDNLPKSYHKQGRILGYLIENPSSEPFRQDAITQEIDVNRQDIRKAIEKGWLSEHQERIYRNPLNQLSIPQSAPLSLKKQQQAAFDQILPLIQERKAETILVQGVTGSGKTEIYLQLLAEVRQRQQSAILLVPEIALTPQMIRQVQGRFQEGVAVLHSGLSQAEKYDEWRRIVDGEANIVVGARSSIFAPLRNIGLIIIDEEHETTYKQGDNPRYHARDVALWRSHYHHCPLILGSATPSLESRARAQKGNYHFIEIQERVNQRPLPPVQIVDMTQVGLSAHALEISPLLQEKIQDRLNKSEQIILLLNRRGYASYVQCRHCGYVFQCPNCDISLTYHKADQQLKCHYCDFQMPLAQICPQCQSNHLTSQGMGTQKIVEVLQTLFPSAKILRMDNDTTRRKGAHERILKQFRLGQADILVGTQMIAKGLDFDKVSLVGVINADASLNIPDFRASERTFQLLTQVSGRSGRGEIPGEVVIQTYNPEHYVIQMAQNHDYNHFFQYEMKYRHLGNYPPYYYLTLVKLTSSNQGQAGYRIHQIKQILDQIFKQHQLPVIILGPSQGPIARLKNQYHYQLILKYKSPQKFKAILNETLPMLEQQLGKDTYLSIDHEPQYFI